MAKVKFNDKQRSIIAKTIAMTVVSSIEALGHKVNKKQLPNIFANVLENIQENKMDTIAAAYDKQVRPKSSQGYKKTPTMSKT